MGDCLCFDSGWNELFSDFRRWMNQMKRNSADCEQPVAFITSYKYSLLLKMTCGHASWLIQNLMKSLIWGSTTLDIRIDICCIGRYLEFPISIVIFNIN